MKVLGIAASPRRNGNSEILLNRALEGASSEGARVEKIVLNELKIKPCQGEGLCRKNGTCFIKDDMRILYEKLKKANAIIVASPVYFGSIPAQLKIVIDRCQSIWVKNFILNKKKVVCSKKGMFISVSGHKNRKFFENSKEIIKIFFMVLRFRLFKELYVSNLEYKGEVLKRKSVLDKAFDCGVSLIDRR